MCSDVCVCERASEQGGPRLRLRGNALAPRNDDGSGKGRTEEEKISFPRFIVDSKLVDH